MSGEDIDPKLLMEKSLIGASIKSIPDLEAEDVWQFGFTSGWLRVECVWRAVNDGKIVLGSPDHMQQFGLPEPVDAVSRILALTRTRTVESVDIENTTSDLTIQFTDDLRIDVFNNSCGYEGWYYNGSEGLELIAYGGGRLGMCYGDRKDWKTIHGRPLSS